MLTRCNTPRLQAKHSTRLEYRSPPVLMPAVASTWSPSCWGTRRSPRQRSMSIPIRPGCEPRSTGSPVHASSGQASDPGHGARGLAHRGRLRDPTRARRGRPDGRGGTSGSKAGPQIVGRGRMGPADAGAVAARPASAGGPAGVPGRWLCSQRPCRPARGMPSMLHQADPAGAEHRRHRCRRRAATSARVSGSVRGPGM